MRCLQVVSFDEEEDSHTMRWLDVEGLGLTEDPNESSDDEVGAHPLRGTANAAHNAAQSLGGRDPHALIADGFGSRSHVLHVAHPDCRPT